MSQRFNPHLIALCGILGILFLGLYFGIGAAIGLTQLPPGTSEAQVLHVATQYHDMWLLGAWLQAAGSLLSVIFILGLVQLAGGVTRFSGVLTLLGCAVLLGVILIEGAFTIDLAQAAVDGHPAASVTSFDVMTVFTQIYPIVPAPLIFLSLGSLLVGSNVLPRILGFLALALGGLYAIAGLVGLFTSPVLTLVPLGLQSLWLLAAAIALVSRSRNTGPAPSAGYQGAVPASH
jgi:hypothetical protein